MATVMVCILIFGAWNLFAQPITQPRTSAEPQTIKGKVIVETDFGIPIRYFLDTDNDGQPDFLLNLGPIWLRETKSDLLPKQGEAIEITGYLPPWAAEPRWGYGYDVKVIAVEKINGKVYADLAEWDRFPYYGYGYGGYGRQGGRGYGWWGGYGPGGGRGYGWWGGYGPRGGRGYGWWGGYGPGGRWGRRGWRGYGPRWW